MYRLTNFSVILIILLSTFACDKKQISGNKLNELILWYDEPAVQWTEALPLGNGTLGAMVFGGISQERLQLNESTIWSGGPNEYAHPGAVKHLASIRGLLQRMRESERNGDWKKARELQKEAEDLAHQEFMSIPLTLAKYQPMADLYLDFPGHLKEENFQSRELLILELMSLHLLPW